MSDALPIHSLADRFHQIGPNARLVVSAPTGSGKSTVIPQWSAKWGKVLVVEPRRVACRGLASRVAELQQTDLGVGVGYMVKQDVRKSDDTTILFVTTGVALRLIAEGTHRQFSTIILDEFHERSLDLDLILALLMKQFTARLIVMSATISGDTIAQHIEGEHLKGEGRTFPVSIQYSDAAPLLPEWRGTEMRLAQVLKTLPDDSGDVLVFVPGKFELQQVSQWIQQRCSNPVLSLHGGLTLKQQASVFKTSSGRRFIVATNVAETSITLPGVTVVIDTGLERRNVYHRGRGYLTLSVIAQDSADQRAGRAGRTQPGTCYRLWAQHGRLAPRTVPEIHREDLSTLLLAAASCGESSTSLPFLDPPKDYALDNAMKTLRLLDALTPTGALTAKGKHLFRVPLDPRLGRLLIEAKTQNTLHDVLPLIAALSVGRPLFLPRRPQHEEDDFQASGCDAWALIRAVRHGIPTQNALFAEPLAEARRTLKHLETEWPPSPSSLPFAIRNAKLGHTLLCAWPDAAYVARRRKRSISWSNGGTEVHVSDKSAIDIHQQEYCIALDSRALGKTRLKRTVIITMAMRAQKEWFIKANLGTDSLMDTQFNAEGISARVDTVYAKHVLQTQWKTPQGTQLLQAIHDGFMKGRLYPKIKRISEQRLADHVLSNQLNNRTDTVLTLSEWTRKRVQELGIDTAEDIFLLSPEDFLVTDIPKSERDVLERRFPSQLNMGSCTYRCTYDVRKKEAVFEKVKGPLREELSLHYLPTLKGWRLILQEKTKRRVLREKR